MAVAIPSCLFGASLVVQRRIGAVTVKPGTRIRQLLPGLLVAAVVLIPAGRRRGDRLSEIAATHKLTLKTLLAFPENAKYRANPGLIHPGDIVRVK